LITPLPVEQQRQQQQRQEQQQQTVGHDVLDPKTFLAPSLPWQPQAAFLWERYCGRGFTGEQCLCDSLDEPLFNFISRGVEL